MKPTKTSDAQKRATRKWMDANKETLSLSLDIGTKDQWKKYAADAGIPLVEFIRQAVTEKVDRTT